MIGDDITAAVVKQNRSGDAKGLPSYLVRIEQEDGTFDLRMNSQGQPYRIAFEYGEDLREIDNLELQFEQKQAEVVAAEQEMRRALGNPLVAEDTQQKAQQRFDEAMNELGRIQKMLENQRNVYREGLTGG